MSFNLNKLVQPECGAPNPLVAAAQQIAMKPSTAASMSRFHQRQAPVNFAKEFMQQKTQTSSAGDAVGLQAENNRFIMRQIGNQSNIVYQNHQIAGPSNTQQQQQQQGISSGKFATDFLAEQELSEGMDRMRMVSGRSDHQMTGGHSSRAAYALATANRMDPQQMMGYMMGISNPITHAMHNTTQVDGINKTSAGDQLETKYRNDMISQDASYQQHNDKGKLGDLDFWQNLSQKYIGPNTYDNIAKMKAESSTVASTVAEEQPTAEVQQMFDQGIDLSIKQEDLRLNPSETEYIFDERNPLKDQFEDPFAEGLKRLEQGDIPSAALLFEAAVQIQPENSTAWRYLGTTQAQNEKDTSAIRALRNCLKLDNSDQQARLAISVSLANEMYHHEACKFLLEWLISHDKYKSVGANLEDFHQLDSELSDDPFYLNAVDQKHYRYVRDKFVEAARVSPNNPDPEVQSALGVLFNMRGEYEKAVDCFKAALSVQSEDSLLWNRLGATLANGNKSDEAVIAYRKALEISPGFLRSRYNLAISLIHLNTYDEAAKQLVQILNMQAAGKGSKNTQIRTRSITSTAIWNTLRTVATLLNKPELYSIIDGRDLARCNEEILNSATPSVVGGLNN